MGLKDRIGKLEGGLPDGCTHCVGWGPRVLYVNDPEAAEAEEPTTPERCTRCGYEPIEIRVEYVESWPPSAVA